MDAIRFVELDPAHLDAVAAIEAVVSPEPWSRQLFAGELEMHAAARHWIVALSDRSDAAGVSVVDAGLDGASCGTVIGFAGAMFVEPDVHVMNIAVDPGHQRAGLGATLLGRLLDDARGRGMRHATLEVRADNAPARALYERFGFEVSGVRAGYYVDGSDALIMWANDIDGEEYRVRRNTLTS